MTTTIKPDIQWVTTAQNPQHIGGVNQATRSGWRLHAILCLDSAKPHEIRGVTALCGLKPRHGWGVDLFIETKCVQCVKVAAMLENIPGSVADVVAPGDDPFKDNPSLNVTCKHCGNVYSLHTCTVCPVCFTFPGKG